MSNFVSLTRSFASRFSLRFSQLFLAKLKRTTNWSFFLQELTCYRRLTAVFREQSGSGQLKESHRSSQFAARVRRLQRHKRERRRADGNPRNDR